MDVTLILDDGTSAVVSWAMDGVVEGIDLGVRRSSGTVLEADVEAEVPDGGPDLLQEPGQAVAKRPTVASGRTAPRCSRKIRK